MKALRRLPRSYNDWTWKQVQMSLTERHVGEYPCHIMFDIEGSTYDPKECKARRREYLLAFIVGKEAIPMSLKVRKNCMKNIIMNENLVLFLELPSMICRTRG